MPPELKPARHNAAVTRFLEALNVGGYPVGEKLLEQMTLSALAEGPKVEADDGQEAFRAAIESGDILGAPIPGANPEVPTLKDAMLGLLTGGAMLPGITSRPQPRVRPGARSRPRPLENNASGESMASREAMNRQISMKNKGQQFGVRKGGQIRKLIGPEAVDYRAQRGEEYGIIMPDGSFMVLDRG